MLFRLVNLVWLGAALAISAAPGARPRRWTARARRRWAAGAGPAGRRRGAVRRPPGTGLSRRPPPPAAGAAPADHLASLRDVQRSRRATARPRTAALMMRDLEFRHHQLRHTLGVEPAAPVRVYAFASAEQKKDLVGAGGTLFAKPWTREIFVHGDRFPVRRLRHELAHVFAGGVRRSRVRHRPALAALPPAGQRPGRGRRRGGGLRRSRRAGDRAPGGPGHDRRRPGPAAGQGGGRRLHHPGRAPAPTPWPGRSATSCCPPAGAEKFRAALPVGRRLRRRLRPAPGRAGAAVAGVPGDPAPGRQRAGPGARALPPAGHLRQGVRPRPGRPGGRGPRPAVQPARRGGRPCGRRSARTTPASPATGWTWPRRCSPRATSPGRWRRPRPSPGTTA